MKHLLILSLSIILIGCSQKIHAEIKNGYEQKLKKAEDVINNIDSLIKVNKNTDEIAYLKKWMEFARQTEENLRENYLNTQKLITSLRVIDPELYYEINEIKDKEGNYTDVYIKAVDRLGFQGLLGTTNISQSNENPNIYRSSYGDTTVCVKVVYRKFKEALQILAHELGHVRYQVPNLASYIMFYRKNYSKNCLDGIDVGHLPTDPSHRSVKETMKNFYKRRIAYKKEMKQMAKRKSKESQVSVNNK